MLVLVMATWSPLTTDSQFGVNAREVTRSGPMVVIWSLVDR